MCQSICTLFLRTPLYNFGGGGIRCAIRHCHTERFGRHLVCPQPDAPWFSPSRGNPGKCPGTPPSSLGDGAHRRVGFHSNGPLDWLRCRGPTSVGNRHHRRGCFIHAADAPCLASGLFHFRKAVGPVGWRRRFRLNRGILGSGRMGGSLITLCLRGDISV